MAIKKQVPKSEQCTIRHMISTGLWTHAGSTPSHVVLEWTGRAPYRSTDWV